MNTNQLEALEGRRLMAATDFLDTSWNGTGVTSVKFAQTGTVADIIKTQVVHAGSNTYVMAQTYGAVQVRQLDANGKVRTDFGKAGFVRIYDTADPDDDGTTGNVGPEIAADASGNLVLLLGRDLYRFNRDGKSLNTRFGTNGKLTLADFKGDVRMAVDADNKIYVTGVTDAGNGLLVERFISRGKFDKTFGVNGRVLVPIVSTARKIGGAVGQGQFVRTFEGGDESTTADDTVVVAGAIGATGYGDGVQVARLKYDGSFAGYGKNGRGVASVLGPKTTDRTEAAITATTIVAKGVVLIEAEQIFHGDRRDDVTHYGGAFTEAGTRVSTGLLDVTDAAEFANGEFVALQSSGTINVRTSKYVGPLAAKGILSSIDPTLSSDAALNNSGVAVIGVDDLDGDLTINGLILYTAGISGSKANVVNVAKYTGAFAMQNAATL